MSGNGSWLDKKMSRETVSYTLPTAMPNFFGTAPAPKKYTKSKSKKGGSMLKLNPDWKQWKDDCYNSQQQQLKGDTGTTGTTAATAGASGAAPAPPPPPTPTTAGTLAATTMTTVALPVVTSMADHIEMNEISLENGGKEIPLADSTNATIELFQQPDVTREAGMDAATAIDQIGLVLSKYEVPIGLMNKLMLLSEFDVLEFIVDDSGSMLQYSDSVHPLTGRPVTRWEEAKARLNEMMELLAYLPFRMAAVTFLNRPTSVTLKRDGRDPITLYTHMVSQIETAFASAIPNGSTPFLEKLKNSIRDGQGKAIARWFFGDGIPNGGIAAQEQIVHLLQNRYEPGRNPITFISCTNEDGEVQWMKDCEEVVPYCSESDDYQDERAEVLRDQGEALPYTRGFHLVCQLVAAICPDDLDAMDESVPLSKPTLDNLLGLQHTETSYKYYFDAFLSAQQKRQVTVDGKIDVVEQWKKQMNWMASYNDFLSISVANQLPAVQGYLSKLKELEATTTTTTAPTTAARSV